VTVESVKKISFKQVEHNAKGNIWKALQKALDRYEVHPTTPPPPTPKA
jgi:hypothetical protein